MKSPIIAALDGMTYDKTLLLTEELDGWVWGVKLEDILWEDGDEILYDVADFDGQGSGARIIMDAKLHHTPDQMKRIAERIKDKPFEFLTVHAAAGPDAIEAAASVLPGKLCASLVLTSMDETAAMSVYGYDHVQVSVKLAASAVNSGCTAIVCSYQELPYMPNDGLFKKHVKKIVAGIRPEWYGKRDDVKRTCTPRRAIDAGADFIVMGRAMTESPDPVAAVQRTLDEIEKG